jgi:hypothetical protein
MQDSGFGISGQGEVAGCERPAPERRPGCYVHHLRDSGFGIRDSGWGGRVGGTHQHVQGGSEAGSYSRLIDVCITQL